MTPFSRYRNDYHAFTPDMEINAMISSMEIVPFPNSLMHREQSPHPKPNLHIPCKE